jgi:hypothetical protein
VCTRVFTARSPTTSGIPTQWFTAYGALSSEIGLSCLRRPRRFHRRLDASVEASGPHVFAVRFSTVRYRHLHVHRIPPRVRDDREPPLRWDGTAVISEVIWVGREWKYFYGGSWTEHPNQPLGGLAQRLRARRGPMTGCGRGHDGGLMWIAYSKKPLTMPGPLLWRETSISTARPPRRRNDS